MLFWQQVRSPCCRAASAQAPMTRITQPAQPPASPSARSARASARSATPSPLQPASSTYNRTLLWFAGVAIAISLPLLVNLVGRVQSEQAMRAAREQMAVQVKNNQQQYEQLQAALTYAQSPAYTEQWARQQAHWARPGEVVVMMPRDETAGARPWWDAFVTR